MNGNQKRYHLKRIGSINVDVTRSLFFLQFSIIILLWIKFKDSYSFVAFDKIYEKRGDLVYDSPIWGYFVLWTSYFLAPLLIIYGLKYGKLGMTIFGVFSSFFIYGISGAKIVLFIPFLIFLFSLLIKFKIDIFIGSNWIFAIGILLAIMFADSIGNLGPVILQRTFGNNGLLTYQYSEFFEFSPYTFYSHNSLIGRVVDYPYKKDLGFVVFNYFNNDYLSGESNSNANFIATDGYAALGNIGVLLINIILGIYLRFSYNQFSNKFKDISTLLLLSFMFMLLNVSFFTCVLSGGWIFINLSSFIKFSDR